MKKIFITKREMYSDIKSLNSEIYDLKEVNSRLDEDLSRKEEKNSRLSDEIENVYNLLKTIKDLTKDKTIETLCILKMADLKNISGVYIHE
jgi:predicted nuclease with TOPRIM domain